ncbi:MFS general substrate transporter [Cadophora sp. DSE1049]|nr:MFS general substrate transporter [Cadophora sp. DSE1049]
MWSYLQYRRIGEQVKEENRRKSHQMSDDSSHAEKALSTTEPWGPSFPGGIPAPQLERSRFSIDQEPQGIRNRSARSQDDRILGWAGAAGSIANSAASREFHVGNVAENLSTAMYLFGISSGSLFVGPLSETVGRNPTYLVSTFFYLAFVFGSALTPTFGGQVVCRFLVGLFASATLAINGSSVRDQFHPVKRAFVFPVIAWANVASPVLAPVAGGWIVSNNQLGWRWTEWVTLIISGGAFLIALLFLPETYLPVLLDWKAKHLRCVTGDSRYISEHQVSASYTKRMKG